VLDQRPCATGLPVPTLSLVGRNDLRELSLTSRVAAPVIVAGVERLVAPGDTFAAEPGAGLREPDATIQVKGTCRQVRSVRRRQRRGARSACGVGKDGL